MGAIQERVEMFLAGERANWPGWLAVAIGLGIAIYFALPMEPPLWAGILAAAATIAACLFCRSRPLAAVGAAFLLALAVGFLAAQLRATLVAAPQLQKRIGFAHVTGRVIEIEPLPGGIRATLDRLTIAELGAAQTPVKIRVRVIKGAADIRLGARLQLLASLQPPSPPMAPGAFDFRRQSYFARLGATGFAMGAPHVLDAPESPSFRQDLLLRIDALRLAIGRRIAALQPGEPGAMARALTVGDQTALTAADTDAMRVSGLAHLLSISGLHIGMAAGLFFVGLRFLMALIPDLALRHPIKKWSAALAIAAAGFYALLAGATVPTERSFIMIAIVFLGVMLDRSPFSLRMVAWAAIAVLLLQPESLVGASFQMSFFAVLGLIAAFEAWREPLARWRVGRDHATDWFGQVGWMFRRGLYWLATMTLTSLVATVMTAPFAMYHFDRLSTYGVVANMLAVPITGFWVMPMGMIALVLMPFGWDAPFWDAMAWGCEAILWIARVVASWPKAVVMVGALPISGLIAIMLGLTALCLMRSRWRLLGLAPVLAGVVAGWVMPSPDLLISGDAKLIAVKEAEGGYRLSSTRAARLTAETWLRRNAQVKAVKFPVPDDPAAGNALACDALGCLYRRNGRRIALSLTGDALMEDCRRADIVVSTIPIRGRCPHPATVIDRFDLWRGGAHAIRIDGDGTIHVESVAATLGDRPWVMDRMRESLRAGRLIGDPAEEGDAEEAAEADSAGSADVDADDRKEN
jgi:competence protein ComEC